MDAIIHSIHDFSDKDSVVKQGTKLTFLARSHLVPKFSKVVAKAKKLGAILVGNVVNFSVLFTLSVTYSST